jgi:hypothetical protein
MKKLAIIVAALFTAIPIFSQYSAGTLKVGLDLGNSPYVSFLSTPNQSSSTQTLYPVGATWISGTNNSLINMVGMEFKFFLADGLACKFIGGGQYSMTPGNDEEPGTSTTTFDPQTDIPTFGEINEQRYYQFLTQLGADYYLVKNNVAIYGGVEVGFRYGASSNNAKFSETAAGVSVSEVYGYQGAINFGAEYGTQQGLFVGVEIRPISLAYSVSTIEPVPGAYRSGDNLTWGFFVYPMLRFGVNF